MSTAISVAAAESFKFLVKKKQKDRFDLKGGTGIAAELRSHPVGGILGDVADVRLRKEEHGQNTYERPKPKSFFRYLLEALSDVFLIALLVCVAVIVGFGIKERRLREVSCDGVSIFVAVFLVSGVSAANNRRQAVLGDKLARESADVPVTVVRAGQRQEISVFDVVVGDVVILKAGDAVPADGVFLTGNGLQVDDSIITYRPDGAVPIDEKDPFLASGATVVEGHGTMLVTAVGADTEWGELMSTEKNAGDPEALQERLEGLTSTIGKIGVAVAVVTFTVRHFTVGTGKLPLLDKGIPLPLAVTLMVTFYMMLVAKDNMHSLSAFETMASVTVICTDKTGMLTQSKMVVADFWVGTDQPRAATAMANGVVSLLREGAGLNTTGSLYWLDDLSRPEISGSPTEKALMSWAVKYLGMDAGTFNMMSSQVVNVEAFNLVKKYNTTTIKDKTTGALFVHWKGAPEVVLAKCSMYVDMNGAVRELGVEQKEKLGKVINGMAVGGLQCIAFAYEEFHDEGLTLLGLVGLKDRCRPEVKAVIKACAKAGVTFKMFTGDDILAARAIATECGIISSNNPDDIVVEGHEFRYMPRAQQLEILDKIRVVARSLPEDKRLLLNLLQHRGDVVGLTGNRTKDAQALKGADVVLSMTVHGTDVTEDTIILNGTMDTAVTSIRWGRYAYNYFQRFIQFHLTVNVVATFVNFVCAITTGDPPLATVQILWANLVMGTMSAVAVATDEPTAALMDRPPVDRAAPLISNAMRRNLAGQSALQTALLLALQYRGCNAFGTDDRANSTMIFNVFVLSQVLNDFNVPDVEKRNDFGGALEKKGMFLAFVAVALVLQVLTVEVLRRLAGTERLGLGLWGVCLAIATVSWSISWAVKFILVPAGVERVAVLPTQDCP